MSALELVKNDGTIASDEDLLMRSLKKEARKLEKEFLYSKTMAMNEVVIEKHGMSNAVANLSQAVESFVSEKWEENPEYDLANEHKGMGFARDVLDQAMLALDLTYKNDMNADFVKNLDRMIAGLTKLRKNYA